MRTVLLRRVSGLILLEKSGLSRFRVNRTRIIPRNRWLVRLRLGCRLRMLTRACLARMSSCRRNRRLKFRRVRLVRCRSRTFFMLTYRNVVPGLIMVSLLLTWRMVSWKRRKRRRFLVKSMASLLLVRLPIKRVLSLEWKIARLLFVVLRKWCR